MKKPLIIIVSDIIECEKEKFFVYTDYCKAIENSGGFPLILPYNKDCKNFLKYVQGIILIGGGVYYNNKERFKKKELSITNPKRYNYEKKIIEIAVQNKIPLMGICRGAQTICEFFGMTLEINPDKKTESNHSNTNHKIKVIKNTFLHKITKSELIEVNSFHKKMIKSLPDGFYVTSISSDNIIESFASKNNKIIGFQFHPERIDGDLKTKVFNYFLKQCKK